MRTGLRLWPGDFLSGCWSSVRVAVPDTRTYRPLRVPRVAVSETRGLSQPESDTCRCLSDTRVLSQLSLAPSGDSPVPLEIFLGKLLCYSPFEVAPLRFYLKALFGGIYQSV